MDSTFRADPQWGSDYRQAFQDLLTGPKLLLLPLKEPPPPPEPQHIRAVPIKPTVDVRFLEGSALRSAILSRMTILKTPNPFIREVHWEGEKIGELAKSPYHLMLWLSSTDKRIPFTSMADAGVFTVAEHLGGPR